MYYYLDEAPDSLVAFQISGTFGADDYDRIIPLLEQRIAEHGEISLLWDMVDFHGWEAGGAWQDFVFDVKHANDLRRIAVVGEQRWQEWLTRAMRLLTKAEVKFFDAGKRPEALHWLREAIP